MKLHIFFITVFFISLSIFSESIILDDGQILKREIISMDVNYIHCKNADGIEEKISRDKVIRVVYKEIKKEDLQDLLTEEEKKKIEVRKEAKEKELEKLKKLKEEEIERKKALAEKQKLEEEKLKKAKKEDLIKVVSKKNDEIENLKEKEKQKDALIVKLEEKITKLEEEIKETNSVLESTKKESAASNDDLTTIKKELKDAKEEIEVLKTKAANQKDETIWAIVGRSAMAPGWGHFYMKQDKPGYIYAGLFWSTFLFTFYNYNQLNASKKDYAATPYIPTQEGLALGYVLSNERFNTYTANQQKYNQSFSLLSLIYIVQITHAYFSGKAYSSNTAIGIRTFDSAYTQGNTSTPNRNYEIFYQFRF